MPTLRPALPRHLAVAAFLTTALAGPVFAAEAVLLPGIVGYGPSSTVYAISGDGSVLTGAADCAVPSPGACAAAWTVSPLAGAFVSSPTVESVATAVSADGSAIAYNTDGAAVARGGAGWGLVDVGGVATGTSVFGLSENGNVAVGRDTGGIAAYWTWNGSGYDNAVLLPLLGSGSFSAAAGISGDAGWIAGWANDGSGSRAVYWSGSPGSYLNPVVLDSIYASSTATAISTNSETIVGFVSDASGETAAFWRTDGAGYGATQTITLPSSYSRALAVSGDGLVIGGSYDDGTITSRAFLYSVTSGTAGDLNTLLATAGLDMGGVKLTSVTGLSYDGTYIAANSSENGYRIFYNGSIAGLSDTASQQASFADVMRSRQAIALQQDAFMGLMTGDLDRQASGAELGAFGLYGSAMGGVRGRAGWGDRLVLTAGLSGGTGDYDALSYKGLMGAAALRYDIANLAPGWRAFAQIGGSFGQLGDLSFTRAYANGAGTATGRGDTSGHVAALYGRLGLTGDLSARTQVQLAAELGERWLSVGGYAETLSAANPFPATVAGGTDRQTVGKVQATWTQALDERLDVTLMAAAGTTFGGASGLSASVAGFGTMTAALETATWVEGGARIGYRATDRVAVDAYATGMTGRKTGTAGHVGGGVRVAF